MPTRSFFLFVVLLAPRSSFFTWAQHSVSLVNNCGFGTATLDQIPSLTLATGSQIYTNATVEASAFLNTGFCGPNGGNCTVVDLHLGDTSGPESSSAVVDLVPTHVFSVPVSFSFFNGCDGAGVSCLTADCVDAIRDPSQDSGIVECGVSTASVQVTFCPENSPPQIPSSVLSTPSSPTSSFAPSTPSSTTNSSVPSVSMYYSLSNSAVHAVSSSYTQPSSTQPLSAAIQPSLSISNPSADSSRATHKMAVNAVAGTVGSIVFLAIILFAALLIRRRRRPATPTPEPYPNTSDSSGNTPIMTQTEKGNPWEPPSSTHQDQFSSTSPSSPASTSPPASQTVEVSLDRIVQGLADRFGWTAPPTSDIDDPGHLPMYRPA